MWNTAFFLQFSKQFLFQEKSFILVIYKTLRSVFGRRGGLMVSALDSG